jgi:hypothetical protein
MHQGSSCWFKWKVQSVKWAMLGENVSVSSGAGRCRQCMQKPAQSSTIKHRTACEGSFGVAGRWFRSCLPQLVAAATRVPVTCCNAHLLCVCPAVDEGHHHTICTQVQRLLYAVPGRAASHNIVTVAAAAACKSEHDVHCQGLCCCDTACLCGCRCRKGVVNTQAGQASRAP